MERPWRTEKPRRSDGWRKQENRLPGLQSGGRKQRGSGNQKGAASKGDGTGDLFLVSAKTTEKKSLRLERKWLTGIVQQARNVGKEPALMFGFDDQGEGRHDWLAFPYASAQVLIRIAEAVLARNFDGAVGDAELL